MQRPSPLGPERPARPPAEHLGSPTTQPLRPLPQPPSLRTGLCFEDLQTELARGLQLRDTGQRMLAFYLTEMETRRLYQTAGYSSTAHYAEERLGLKRRRTRELIAVGRKLLTLPAIDAAFAAGRIGWAKLLSVVRVATPEHEAAWLQQALDLTCRKLALLVCRSREGAAPRKPGEGKGLPEIRFPVSMSVDPLVHRAFELAQKKLSAERGRPVDAAECLGVLAHLFLQLEEDGSVKGRTRVSSSLYRIVLREEPDAAGDPDAERPLVVDSELGPVPVEDHLGIRCDAQRESASGERPAKDVPTPAHLRRRVLARDGHQCRCCRSRLDLMVHHIQHRSLGGPTRADNLLTLCTRCHALVHADLLVLRGGREGRIRFEDARGAALEAGLGGERSPPALLELATWRPAILHPTAPMRDLLGAPEQTPAAAAVDRTEAFAGIVGQDLLLERLEAAAKASRARRLPHPHTLFVGPPGTGKTTLARGIAKLIGARVQEACGAQVGDTQALADLVAALQVGDVLFLDEIHAVPRPVLEMLYGMLDRAGDESGKVFTLVAATTEEAQLPDALRSRFGLLESLQFYEESDLAALARVGAERRGATLERDGARTLSRAARGTPRELLRLLERALDEAALRGETHLSSAAVDKALTRMGFDARGLHPTEQRYLDLLSRNPRPVPLARLARMLGLPCRTVMRHIEPFLFERGLIQMTARGRVAARV